MRALFDATCDLCDRRRPRCALVTLRGPDVTLGARILCEECRQWMAGRCRLHPRHGGGGKEAARE